ncbi:MAG TPA: hypothetical protein VJ731_08760 [Terriglobales bacterium]|jgi:hypothetical protein|nr:hypothetical protein [Terriglobales bacterium]
MLSKTGCFLLLACAPVFAAQQTWTGQISDEMCGADHSGMNQGGKVSAHDCTIACVKGGSKFVFVSGGKVYAIQNQNLPDLTKHAGHTVNLTGDLGSDGKTITASKVEMTH